MRDVFEDVLAGVEGRVAHAAGGSAGPRVAQAGVAGDARVVGLDFGGVLDVGSGVAVGGVGGRIHGHAAAVAGAGVVIAGVVVVAVARGTVGKVRCRARRALYESAHCRQLRVAS